MSQPPARGDVWWCDMPVLGRRPFVILSRDSTIGRRHHVLAAPCTTTIRGLESEALLEPGEDPVPYPSAVNLDSIQEIPIAWFTHRLGRISDARMHQVCEALKVAVGCR